MNKVVLMGRLTKDPEVRYSQGTNPTAVARYTLAVTRRFQKEGQPEADFITCVAFGKSAEFAEKYLKKGMKIVISGRIQTGSYERQDGTKVYTTDVIVDEQDFCESKKTQENPSNYANNNEYQQPPMSGQPNGYQQPPMSGQPNGYQQPPMSGQPNGYQQPPMGGQPNGYQQPPMGGQPNGYQQPPMNNNSSMVGDSFMNIPDGIEEELPFS